MFQTNVFLSNVKTESTKGVRVAYLMFVHGRSLRQIMRLLQRIHREEDFIYIHVDSRSDFLYKELKYLDNGKNIKITERRFAMIWAGTSLLEAQLSAMKEMFELNWSMDFVTTLSGADYILRTPEEFSKYLEKYNGMNFIQSTQKLFRAGIDHGRKF